MKVAQLSQQKLMVGSLITADANRHSFGAFV